MTVIFKLVTSMLIELSSEAMYHLICIRKVQGHFLLRLLSCYIIVLILWIETPLHSFQAGRGCFFPVLAIIKCMQPLKLERSSCLT